MKGNKNWVKTAIKHPGTFKAYAKNGKMTMKEAIAKGKKSKNSKIRRRAILAETLMSFHKK